MASIKALMARVKAALEDRKNQTWMLLGSLTLYVIVAGVAAGMFSKVPILRSQVSLCCKAWKPGVPLIYIDILLLFFYHLHIELVINHLICIYRRSVYGESKYRSAESVLGISWIVCFIELIVFVVRKYKAQPLLPNGRGKRLLIVLVNRVLLILVQGCTGAAEGLPSFLSKTSSSRDAVRYVERLRLFTRPAFAASLIYSLAVDLINELAVPDSTDEQGETLESGDSTDEQGETLESGTQDNPTAHGFPPSPLWSLVFKVLQFILALWAMCAKLAVNLMTNPAVPDSTDEQEVESGTQDKGNPPAQQFPPSPLWSLVFRVLQFTLAFWAMCTVRLTSDYTDAPAFVSLVNQCICQCAWSSLLAIAELCSLYGYGSSLFQNSKIRRGVSIGDLVLQGSLFDAACGAASLITFSNDLQECSWNNCPVYEKATLLAFGSYISSLLPSLYITIKKVYV